MNTGCLKLCLASLILLLWSSSASAQSPVPFQSTGLPNTIYSGGNVDSVDTTSGNLRITIPLLHLPGRGLDTDIVLSYNSKIWITSESIDPDTGFSTYVVDMDADANSYAPGWGIGVPRMGRYGNSAWVCQSPTCGQSVFYLDWVMNDGTRVFMQDDIGQFSSCAGFGTWSYDGTYMRFPGTPGVCDFSRNRVGRYKGGVKVLLPDPNDVLGTETLTDTNGNFISCATTGCTDSLGRVITYNYEHVNPYGVVVDRLQSITYKDSSGTPQTVTFGYQNVNSYYPMTWLSSGRYTSQGSSCPYGDWCFLIGHNPGWWLLTSVTLPNNKSYQFEYLPNVDTDAAGASTGLLRKIILPTGGYIRYTYTNGQGNAQYAAIASRVVSSDGTPGSEKTWTYSIGGGAPNSVSQVTDPLQNIQTIQFDSKGWAPATITYKNPAGTALRTITRTTGCDETTYNNADIRLIWKCSNPRTLTEITTLNDTNQQSKHEFTYTTYGNVSEKKEYAFDVGAPGSLVRRTTFSYLPDANTAYADNNVHILDRVASGIVYDAGGSIQAQTQFEYDNYTESLTASGAVQRDSSFGTGYTTRGNVTASQRWRNTDGAWLTTRNQYDDAGNVRKTTDPLNHSTTFSYADSWGNGTCAPSGGSAAAYRTTITNALSQAIQNTYNSCSGTLSSTKDPNNQTTSFSYDALARLMQVSFPDGGQVNYAYYEAARPFSITTTRKIDATRNLVNTAAYDGLGRVTQTQLNSDPQGVAYVDTTYDALGREATLSNPYRSTADPTYGITTFNYDALGRVTQLDSPSGSSVTTAYCGNAMKVTDQAGKWRRSITDALGRLIAVHEPNSATASVTACTADDPALAPIAVTSYGYDVLDNLLSVLQSNSRQRTFTYNSLSQLTSAINPESQSCTVTYTYDNDGNLLTKTAPAPNQTGTATVTTTFAYDQLHRVTAKTFSNLDPALSYFYDQTSYNGLTITNGIGRRTGMSDAGGAEAWSYDTLGRVLTDRRQTNGVTKSTTYTYNLDGSVATVTYPSGRIITYAPGGAGRPLSAVDTTTTGNYINYALSASYAPQGALSSLVLGQTATFAGINLNQAFNSRLQPTSIRAWSTNATSPVALDLAYCFNKNIDLTTNNCAATPVINNGNVAQIKNNQTPDRTQNYTYDELNRIKTAKTQATTGPYCWGETFTYDIWANLLSMGGAPGYTGCTQEMLNVAATRNNQISGYTYDAAGNLTATPAPGSTTYTYDAESHLASTPGGTRDCGGPPVTVWVNYGYNGDGLRVRKTLPWLACFPPPEDAEARLTKLYWYGTGGEILVETDGAGAVTSEHIFFGGKRIARRDGFGNVFYYFADHLGTARVVTSATGTVLDDADFYPFGGERPVLSGSGNSYKFTGKERDSESGLDYFGARYFAATMGRFMSPDPDNASAFENIDDPQSWNGYAYGRNNPLLYADPDGRVYCRPITEDERINGIIQVCDVTDKQYKKDPSQYAGYSHYVLQGGFTDPTQDVPSGGDPLQGPSPLLLAAAQGTQMAEPSVMLAFNATKKFGEVVAPLLMTAVECLAGDPDCSKTGIALALVPGGRAFRGLTPGARKLLRGLLPLANETVANAIRIRGGGGAQVRFVASWLQQKSVAEVANLAAEGNAEAKTAIKIIEQAARLAQK